MMNANHASTPLLSPLNNIHFLNYLIQPPTPLPPPPAISEMASFCIPDALSERINTFIKAFDAQINRSQPEASRLPMAISHFHDPIRQVAGVDELYFHVKNHLKQEPIKTLMIVQDLNNCAVQFYNFIKKSSEIKYFDDSTFQILIKFAYMQQNEREFVAASYVNGQFWQKFQSLAKFPSKQNELDFFGELCKFFFIFIYQYQIQLINNVTTRHSTLSSFLNCFPYDFSQIPSLIDSVTIPPPSNNSGPLPNNIPSLNNSQHGNNPQSLQLNNLSSQSLTLLLEAALKTFCNANVGNTSTSLTTNPSAVPFQVSNSAQNAATINQVSPAPSDPIPPIQGTPPADNKNVLNSNNLITYPSTSTNQAQGIFSYPVLNAITGISGITPPFGFGSNNNQFNRLINPNIIFGETQVTQNISGCAGNGTATLSNSTDQPCTSLSKFKAESEDNNNQVIPLEESNTPSTSRLHSSEEAETSELSEQCERQSEEIFIYENNIEHISQDLNESDPSLEHQTINESHMTDNCSDNVAVSDSECLESVPQQKITEIIHEKSAPAISRNEDEPFEAEDYKQKTECQVPVETSKNSTEVLKIAPLKIKLKLLQTIPPESKPLKRKSHHKSRRVSKKDDDDETDNEYKSRIKIEDFDSFDTCYTDPLALRKIQRKTSAQIKEEQETFIERIYNQADDERKLKVIYPNVQAEICYNPGDYITKFIGDIITSRSVYNENKDNPFLIEIGRNKWIDGKDRRSFGVYILPSDIPQRANTTIKLHTTKNNIVFVGFYATQKIYPGEFLYFRR